MAAGSCITLPIDGSFLVALGVSGILLGAVLAYADLFKGRDINDAEYARRLIATIASAACALAGYNQWV